jgi:hypothetical protein
MNKYVRIMMVELLVSQGADVNTPNIKRGETGRRQHETQHMTAEK